MSGGCWQGVSSVLLDGCTVEAEAMGTERELEPQWCAPCSGLLL